MTAVAVSADGRRAVSGSWDLTVKVWDLENGVELHKLFRHSEAVDTVAVSADGRRALSSSCRDFYSSSSKGVSPTVKVWDLENDTELHNFFGHSDVVTAIAVSADGRQAVSGSKDQTVKVWDLEAGKVIATFFAEGTIKTVQMRQGGSTIIAGDILGRIHVLRAEMSSL
jgi:WD40 repeat protein